MLLGGLNVIKRILVYLANISDDSDLSDQEKRSVAWLLRYTEDCPECAAPIQKNGGCNHMSCKSCGYQYCWICKSNWHPYVIILC